MTPDFKDERGLLTQCPDCLRTIWANTVCHHGTVPVKIADAPKEPGTSDPPKKSVKHERRRKLDPFDDEDHS